eukprot:4123359-Pleurochrysis_carterae.AAC.1
MFESASGVRLAFSTTQKWPLVLKYVVLRLQEKTRARLKGVRGRERVRGSFRFATSTQPLSPSDCSARHAHRSPERLMSTAARVKDVAQPRHAASEGSRA